MGQGLLPVFQIEGAGLEENDYRAVAHASIDTLNAATAKVLAQQDLDPVSLANYLLTAFPPESYHFGEAESALYRRIIAESCTYIVEIASQAPAFFEKTLGELLARQTQVSEKVDQLSLDLQRLYQRAQQEAMQYASLYRRTVGYALDKLELFGASMRLASTEQSLKMAYVPLTVEQQKVKMPGDLKVGMKMPSQDFEVAIESGLYRERQRSNVLVDDTLAQARRHLIRGPAGSGKTTLLQWLAVSAATQSFLRPLEDWNGLFPFYIRLRSHVREVAEQLDLPSPDAFPRLISRALSAPPAGWVEEQLVTGHALVLVDGVDEVPEGQRGEVREWMEVLMREYTRSYFIVTSRPPAVGGEDWASWLAASGFQDALLQPMALPDIFVFVDRWYDALAEKLSDEGEKAELRAFAQDLKRELKRDLRKRDLATSPLLCAMLCALNRDRRQQLPSDRTRLYEVCCELLVERRDKERKVPLSDYPAARLEYSQKLLLLQDLAYWMTKGRLSEADVTRVSEFFQTRLTYMRNIPQGLSQNGAGKDVCKFFVERTSIIREPMTDHIDFTHRTFQEFLTAKEVLHEDDIEFLVQHAHDDQWREVVLLASGLAQKKKREDLIDKLIGQGDTDRAHRVQLFLLAATCLEASPEELRSNLKLLVQKRLSTFLPPKNMEEAKALVATGELAVPYLKWDATKSEDSRAACAYALGHLGGEDAFRLLEAYGGDSSTKVSEILWNIWSTLQEEERTSFAQRILSQTQSTRGSRELLIWVEGISVRGHTSLDELRYCTRLTSLALSDCEQITDLSPLSGLTGLTSLDLRGCEQITDLSPLARLTRLLQVQVSEKSYNHLTIPQSIRRFVGKM